jgi:phosphoglycerate dehydrogenase-like enzyme
MRVVVAIHDLPVWTIPPAEVDRIASALPDDEVLDAREADARRELMPTADVLFATRIRAHEFVPSRVRWIHSSAVGVGALLIPEVVESPVVVSCSRGVHSEAIAEHAIALALALRRNLHLAVPRQAARIWAQDELSRRRVKTLSATHLLVVGLGTIGARVAAWGAAMGMQVTGIRKRVSETPPQGVTSVLPPERLRDALADADVVVLALPRTEETRALIGRAELGAMKPTAILINVARGRLIDEPALIGALQAGRLGGAGLDAFSHEPLPADSPFWTLPNVLITPHTAAFAGDYWPPVVDLFLENMARFRRGQDLINVVDKRLGY